MAILISVCFRGFHRKEITLKPRYSSLMDLSTKVALIGDFHESVIAHQAIPVALRLCGAEGVWMHTASLGGDVASQLSGFAGVWCVPASPYANMQGALDAIRYARESKRPFLGTCGGFQHAIIEYARNVCGMRGADHAESNPEGNALLIAPLVCPLVEQTEELLLEAGSIVSQAYGGIERIRETYHCSFGFNPDFEAQVFTGGPLRASVRYANGEIRGMELRGHPFYVATLFQPERRALEGIVPPLVRAFVEACRRGGYCGSFSSQA